MFVSNDQWSACRMDLAMSANGKQNQTYERAKAFKSGLMEVCMKATGRRTKPTFSADFCIKMATSIRVNGKMIKRMALVTISTRMAVCTEVSGRMILKMVRVSNAGLMALSLKATTHRVSSKAMVFSHGLTGIATREILLQITFKARVLTDGVMDESTLACGKTIRCMVTESYAGLTANATKVTTMRTRNTATALSTGQTVTSTPAGGRMVSSTVKAR